LRLYILVSMLKAPTEEQMAAGGAGGAGKKAKGGKKKKGKAAPLPAGMLECYLHATTALRHLSFNVDAIAAMITCGAQHLLVPLLDSPAHAVRRNAVGPHSCRPPRRPTRFETGLGLGAGVVGRHGGGTTRWTPARRVEREIVGALWPFPLLLM
jgi:hypothetical protein